MKLENLKTEFLGRNIFFSFLHCATNKIKRHENLKLIKEEK